MEALKRSSPVPISIETMAGKMDGYFDLEHQDIALRKGMSEVQTVSAAIHEVAHALLHNRVKEQVGEDKIAIVSRNTEEVQAESISYAVCAYYGIATAENSFGYIATWSKDKTLPELKNSLEVINKTANSLIGDIDKHYAEIITEQEQALIAAEPENLQERLFEVGTDKYLHVQRTDEGFDYTLYDKNSKREIDGGQLDTQEGNLTAAAVEVCKLHDIPRVESISVSDIGILDKLQEAENAAIYKKEPVQEISPKTETEVPDPAISIEARNAFGYTDQSMLPLTKERAMELFEQNVPVYMLYGDNTEAIVSETEDILQHAGVFGIDSADWERVKDSENYLKNAEMAVEDDYGMIDGIINNGPKEEKPEGDLSALFSQAEKMMQRENTPKKEAVKRESVLAKLQAPTPPPQAKTEHKKSAERDVL